MPSQATCRIADAGVAAAIAAQQSAIAELEKRLWADGLDESLLEAYQAAFRHLEELIAAAGDDNRHEFVVVIAVADRPQHLRSCLESLLELCRAYGYGGTRNGRYGKVAVLIADDSSEAGNIAINRGLARHYSRLGIATSHFGQDEQFALVDALGNAGKAALARVLGDAPRNAFGRKGQGVMRNIAALKLNEMPAQGRRLFYAVDSDQEFKVKVSTARGDKEVCAVNFFYRLDEIFATTDAHVLTGKVVGDPPVSPAVMTGNFLEDVIGFLRQTAEGDSIAAASPGAPCRHHESCSHRQGEAAYHDMADLFGFRPAGEAYGYRCTLVGAHTEADCFNHFAARLDSFFYGEHPTRVSYYLHQDVLGSVQPARTVYVGNYVFRPAALKYFIPFAALRLRMSGPTLGRIIRSELGDRFVSANLPMLHKRTVRATGRSEFRPGIDAGVHALDLGGEFERQFYGDVMLFSVERLTATGFPRQPLADATIAAEIAAVRAEMLEKYNARHRIIRERLARLDALLHDPANWWNRSDAQSAAVGRFAAFVANVAHNFGPGAAWCNRINAPAHWETWRTGLLEAVTRYPADRLDWSKALAATGATHPAPPHRRPA